MAIKNVTSSDPRKPVIVKALLKKSGDPVNASRVTLLKEDTSDGTFTGRVLKYAGNRRYTSVGDGEGFFTVTAAECGLESNND